MYTLKFSYINDVLVSRFYVNDKLVKVLNKKNTNIIIDELNKSFNEINGIRFSKNHILFKLNDMNIILQGKDVINDNEVFKSIINKYKDKKYSMVKTRIIQAESIVLATLPFLANPIIVSDDNSNLVSSYVSVINDEAKDDITLIYEDEVAKEKKSDDKNKTDELESTIIQTFNVGKLYNSSDAKKTRDVYGDIIQKYCDKYDLDYDLMCAIATQESSGDHYNNLSSGGLFQIERKSHLGEVLYGKKITEDAIVSIDSNIEIGCMIFKNYLDMLDGNVLAATVAYNSGIGTCKSIVESYAKKNNQTPKEVLEGDDFSWTYKKRIGDTNYLENTLRYCNKDAEFLKDNHIHVK